MINILRTAVLKKLFCYNLQNLILHPVLLFMLTLSSPLIMTISTCSIVKLQVELLAYPCVLIWFTYKRIVFNNGDKSLWFLFKMGKLCTLHKNFNGRKFSIFNLKIEYLNFTCFQKLCSKTHHYQAWYIVIEAKEPR